MSKQTAVVIFFAIKMLWIFAVMGTTAYAVFWLDRSGWWFLLALILASFASNDDKKGSA